MTNTVTGLLTAEGFAPLLTFDGFAAAVRLAEAISQTIGSPIRRAQFVADAAADLARLDYQSFEGLDGKVISFVEMAEAARPTPCGSTELWGSLLQWVDEASAKELRECLQIAFRAFSHDDDGPVWADSLIARTERILMATAEY